MNQLPLHRRCLYGIANWALLIAGLANLAVGTYSAIDGSATIAVTSLTAGLVLLFAATIDRFESLKGLGVEAKTRQLDEKLVQADDALRRLREITELTGSTLIDLNSKMGRMGSAPGPRESIALADRIRRIMTGLGSDPQVIAVALRPWAKILCFDASRALTRELEPVVRSQIQSVERKRQQIPEPIAPDNQEFLKLNAQLTQLNEYLERLRHFGAARLEEYPEVLMNLFDTFPCTSPETLTALHAKAEVLAVGMKSLRDYCTLENPELWISMIEQARER